MQFRIQKYIQEGKYYVLLKLAELSESDHEKAKLFGEPSLIIKLSDGRESQRNVKGLNISEPYGFILREDAENYAEFLKKQIHELKERWSCLCDDFSHEEVI